MLEERIESIENLYGEIKKTAIEGLINQKYIKDEELIAANNLLKLAEEIIGYEKEKTKLLRDIDEKLYKLLVKAD